MYKRKSGLTIGVDLGGTKLEVALVDDKGRILEKRRQRTDFQKGPGEIIADIETCALDCLKEASAQADALGIGVAGQVDAATGALRFAPNLGWREVPLRAELMKALGLPVLITNDVRAATFGEWVYGAGRGTDDLVCLFVGTGIGGGIVSGGRLLEGFSNTAGELGHMTIIVGGRRCHCPNQGCLEAYAGGWAIGERAREAAGNDPGGEELLALAGSAENVTTGTVARAYHGGNALARRLIDETIRYLAAGIVSIVNAFNPRLLILGGGVIEGMPEMAGAVEQEVKSRALPAAVESLKIVKAALGGEAGVIGAATLAAKKLVEQS
jgi:glucokinase